jgi:serine/threonine protein kinase
MIFNNKYEQKALIGKSGFNIVYKVLDKESNNFYALKFITNIKNNEINNYKERYKKEIEVMKNIKSR